MNADDAQLEIAHVLFIDIVGYSKRLVNEQTALVMRVNEMVRASEQARVAEANGKLIRIPTGDGMALAFFTSPDAPVRCAIEIARALQSDPRLRLRMGIDSGPVEQVSDVNDRSNVAGAGINMAQRVMDCGDAGHILLSKRVAGDLGQFSRWQAQLHDLGEVEVKHGVKIGVVNFVDGGIGNPALPEKVRRLRHLQKAAARRRMIIWSLGAGAALAALYAILWIQTRRAALPAAPSVVEKSIAVLPFVSLSKEEENAFFADGVQDEILTNLARVADLRVISRTSVMQYKAGAERNIREIARALGVANVLEGSVQRIAGRVRVTAQLIDARNDAHIWAEHYDRELADVFAIQSEIAQRIADQLRAKLSAGEKNAIENKPTKDLAAYDLYLRAKELLHGIDPRTDLSTDNNLTEALALLEQTVARDPTFALAWSLLAEANLQRYWTQEHPESNRKRADEAVQKALELAPEAGETHLARAHFYYYALRDYDHALEELEKAARVLPNNAEIVMLSGLIERRLGRWSEAARHMVKAVELNPRELTSRLLVCGTYRLMRRYAEAIKVADQGMIDFPKSSVTFLLKQCEAALEAGDLQMARATLAAVPPDDSDLDIFILHYQISMYGRDYEEAKRIIRSRNGLEHREQLAPDSVFEGEVARAEGRMEEAKSAFLEARQGYDIRLRDHPKLIGFISAAALVDAALGHKAEALHAVQNALEINEDPLERPGILITKAIIHCRLGDRDECLRLLEELAKIPQGINYGSLRFDPEWDSLRGDPRFEKIVAELRPK